MHPSILNQRLRDDFDNAFHLDAQIVGFDEIPDFTRETEFVSLKGEDAYPWIGGELVAATIRTSTRRSAASCSSRFS